MTTAPLDRMPWHARQRLQDRQRQNRRRRATALDFGAATRAEARQILADMPRTHGATAARRLAALEVALASRGRRG